MKPGARELSGDGRLTFLAHAISMSSRYGPGPWPSQAQELPDEPPRPDGGGKVFLPSVVLDGIRTHHFSFEPEPGTVAQVAGLVESGVPYGELHERLADVSALAICDDLVRELARRRVSGRRVYEAGWWLAEYGTRREATKVGIVLVGACGGEADRELLLLLGALEEFTLYAVVALARTQPEPQRAVYELARRVRSWGRIHAVERLEGCADPEVKAWLLRDGYRNGIMDEYLAPLAATTGDLYGALLEPEPDDALVDGAGGILAALFRGEGGPTSGISAYGEAVPALARYADVVAGREATFWRLEWLLTILGSLREPPEGGFGWRAGDLDALRRRYEAVVAGQRRWAELVLTRLAQPAESPGAVEFGWALRCAFGLGLDVLPQAVARLRVDSSDDDAWDEVGRRAGPGELVALAEELLPLESLAGGPEERDFGEGHEWALESVVAALAAHPGAGLSLIRTALRNRVVRIRREALATLGAWPEVPEEAVRWVRAAYAREPEEGTREEMRALLRQER